MDWLFNLLGMILVFILGGGVFWFIGRNKNLQLPESIPALPSTEDLNKIRKDKENELLEENSETFIDNHLANADDVNDVKRTSDDEFGCIRDRHRRDKDLDG